ncbi:MAG: metalloregulator ArsR/SmtB family transcription factor [Caulobacteraceae bacterium]|nr:metalloregulator ArsR/SmtB family transcription factor [Caulobacteraceae bacterium]
MTETLLDFFKALAHESRLRIVGLLAQREYSVQELAALLDLKEPTVSHHLAILKAQGLVTVRAEGTTRWHALDTAALESLSRRVLEATEAAAPLAADENEARILAGFVDADERLKEIPASRRKRAVVLRWLMRMFEPGQRYTEAEINGYLKSRHWDCATLRRELVGHRMLARDAGIYWRLPKAQWRDETIGP